MDNRFCTLFKNGASPRSSSYQLATHSVSVKRSGIIGEVADIWKVQGEETPNQKQSLNRLKSYKGIFVLKKFFIPKISHSIKTLETYTLVLCSIKQTY